MNVPFLLEAFFKMIAPFVDPLTRPRLRFNPDCITEGLFTPDWLAQQRVERVREHRRRERLWEKWREHGAKVGVREWEFKCDVALQDVAKPAGETALRSSLDRD
ncbi:hypothetical protein OH76DRAFT_1481503 [Lentinus brumalis]|uniref:Uncharacterized protein n=1 Tax=Lentinus brumalis TaxID=2498619 RepID=A0A371DGF3_9APHY|nr:hypothetical protein OH76DRAFT_1481503 [Polyporus brumalis]